MERKPPRSETAKMERYNLYYMPGRTIISFCEYAWARMVILADCRQRPILLRLDRLVKNHFKFNIDRYLFLILVTALEAHLLVIISKFWNWIPLSYLQLGSPFLRIEHILWFYANNLLVYLRIRGTLESEQQYLAIGCQAQLLS